jgi:hypothetical protein
VAIHLFLLLFELKIVKEMVVVLEQEDRPFGGEGILGRRGLTRGCFPVGAEA